MTTSVLAPMFVTVTWMATEAPWLISIMAITAATPMITPSIVSAVAHHVAPQGLQGDPRRAGRHAQAVARGAGGAAAWRRAGAGHAAGDAACRAAGIFHDLPVGDANHAVGVPGHVGVVGHQQDGDALVPRSAGGRFAGSPCRSASRDSPSARRPAASWAGSPATGRWPRAVARRRTAWPASGPCEPPGRPWPAAPGSAAARGDASVFSAE